MGKFLALMMIIAQLDSVAYSQPTCTAVFTRLYSDSRRAKFLTAEDEAAIGAIRTDSTLVPEARAEEIFRVVLNAKLRNAPPEVRDEVRRTLAVVKSNPNIGGSYNSLSKNLVVSMPDYLLGSSVEYMLKTHELEHVYQTAELARAGHRSALVVKTIDIYLAESDAMTMEWNYFHQISREDRRALLTRVNYDVAMKRKPKKWLIAALELSDLPVREYLDGMRKLGRYSKNSLKMTAYVSVAMVSAAFAGIAKIVYVNFIMGKTSTPEAALKHQE